MHQETHLHGYLQYLYDVISMQSNQMSELEAKIEQLNMEVTQLKKEPKIHIDKVEYHFDQLKVETLEGTLNIGFSPGNLPEQIEEFRVNGKEFPNQSNVPTRSESFQRINKEVNRYLSQDIHQELLGLLQKYHLPDDPDYHQFIVEDIRKQIDHRIQHYIREMQLKLSSDNVEAVEDSIIERVIADIRIAMEDFLRNMTQREE